MKSPFVKETTTEVTDKTTTTADSKTDNSKTEVKETRYYQFVSDKYQEMDSSGNPIYMTYELVLYNDGTAKDGGLALNDFEPMSGKYVENDKYVFVILNNPRCVEGTYNQIAGGCTDTMVLVKDGDTLKYQSGELFHFEIDDVEHVFIYKQVQKSDLVSDLKN